MDRVAYASIFRFGDIGKIYSTCSGNEFDILEYSTEFDCIEYLRFILARQVNTFSIATAFEIKYAFFSPAMFIITNQAAIRVSAECCFSGS